jgi:hypothetical protein
MGEAKRQCRECTLIFIRQKVAQKYCSFKCFYTSRVVNRRLRYREKNNSQGRPNSVKWGKTQIEVTAEEIRQASENLTKTETGADFFDAEDWESRAKESQRKILEKYG